VPDKKPKRRIKRVETVRERAEKTSKAKPKTRHVHSAAGKVTTPLKAVINKGRKEYHFLHLPDNRVGRFLNKRGRLSPRFFGNAWRELKQVVWPSRRETFKLTLAVISFAIVFGLLVAVTDYGLDKLFREVLLK